MPVYIYILIAFSTIGGLLFILFVLSVLIKPPAVDNLQVTQLKREKIEDDFYAIGKCWLKKNDSGLWEMYIEGGAFDRGIMNGKLAEELVYKQEQYFINQIHKVVPSQIYQFFLKMFIAWINRNLKKHIIEEYNKEIYGISFSASDKFSFVGPEYLRFLNYHAANDIAHTLQNLNFVGCSSFSAWGDRSEDGKLIVGRNFDFYFGDEFSKEKIVTFYAPDTGNKFMMMTWGGMVGTVSGMNLAGITVTVNGAKSEFRNRAATPIALLAREILQYARNIEEAFRIANERNIFVSELIMIGSASDNKTAIIEKTPSDTFLYSTGNDHILCTNHFQGEELKSTVINKNNMEQSSSLYRYKRLSELFNKYPRIGLVNTVEILRNYKGLGDTDIGIGNEKTINQMVAHHSIIFKPGELKVWVSTGASILEKYVCYDLVKIFDTYPGLRKKTEIHEQEYTIPCDPFYNSPWHRDYKDYKSIATQLKEDKTGELYDEALIQKFMRSNPEFFLSYSIAGDYYMKKEKFKTAAWLYETALKKEISTDNERKKIERKLKRAVAKV